MEIRGSLLARNTGLNFVGLVVAGLVTLVSMPVIIRGLGAEDFGIFSVALVILGYFGLFDLGLGRATTKFAAECLTADKKDQLPGLVWTSLGIQLLLGLLGAVFFAAAAPILVREVFKISPAAVGQARIAFFILASSLPVVLGTTTLRGVLEAGQRFDLVNAVKIPAVAATYLLPAVSVGFGLRLPAILFILVVARLVAFLSYWLLCRKVFPVLRQGLVFDSRLIGQLLSYGSWITVSNVVSPVLVYLDRFLIASLLSMAAVTYYAAPYELANAFLILPTSLVATLFPAFSALGATADRQLMERLYVSSTKALMLTMGPVMLLLAFFAPNILQLWLGGNFAQTSGFVLRVFAIGVLVNSLAWIPFSLLQGVGRPDLTAKFHLLELPLYVAFAWLLITRFGIQGAAAAWFLRVALDALLLFGACGWLRLGSLRALAAGGFSHGMGALLLFALFLTMAMWAGISTIRQVMLAVLAAGLFGLAAWRYVLDNQERSFLTTAVQNIVGKPAQAR